MAEKLKRFLPVAAVLIAPLFLLLTSVVRVSAAPDPGSTFVIDTSAQAIATAEASFLRANNGCSISSDATVNTSCTNEDINAFFVNTTSEETAIIAIPIEQIQNLDRTDIYLESDLTGRYVVYNQNGQRILQESITIETSINGAGADFQDTCADGLGVLSWILCPVAEFMNNVTSSVIEFVLGTLKINPILVGIDDAGTDNSVMNTAWRVMLQIANSLLVVAFLILIYLQLSGSQQYMVQKMLPRLVVITILMQLSYIIAALIIDIGNILAAGIGQIFDSINGQVLGQQLQQNLRDGALTGPFAQASGTGALVEDTTQGLFLTILGGTALVFTGLNPYTLFVSLIGLFIGAIAAVIALAARQLLIVVFIVLSPFAMLMGVFPQTEKWMKEWFDNLIKLVMIYPLMVMVIGVGSFVSTLAATTNAAGINQIIATLIPIIVLFAIPYLFSLAGRTFRAISGGLMQRSGGLASRIKGDPKDPRSMAARARNRTLESRSNRFGRLAGDPNSAYGRTMRRGVHARNWRGQKQMHKISPTSLLQRMATTSWDTRERLALKQNLLEGIIDPANVHQKHHGLVLGAYGSAVNDRFISFNKLDQFGSYRYQNTPQSKDWFNGEGQLVMGDDFSMGIALGKFVEDSAGGHPMKALVNTMGVHSMQRAGYMSGDALENFHNDMVNASKGANPFMKGIAKASDVEEMVAAGVDVYGSDFNYDFNRQIETLFADDYSSIESQRLKDVRRSAAKGALGEMGTGNLSTRNSATTFKIGELFFNDNALVDSLMDTNTYSAQDVQNHKDQMRMMAENATRLVQQLSPQQMQAAQRAVEAAGGNPNDVDAAEFTATYGMGPAQFDNARKFAQAAADFKQRNSGGNGHQIW